MCVCFTNVFTDGLLFANTFLEIESKHVEMERQTLP